MRVLWDSGRVGRAGFRRHCGERVVASPMKTLRLVLAPTRNRRLNELLGLLMLVGAGLLLLSIVSYRPTDPSLNTASGFVGPHPVHNWAGIVGASISDLLLQVEGIAALWFPVLLAALGFSWMRSRPAGSMGAKLLGAGLIYDAAAPGQTSGSTGIGDAIVFEQAGAVLSLGADPGLAT